MTCSDFYQGLAVRANVATGRPDYLTEVTVHFFKISVAVCDRAPLETLPRLSPCLSSAKSYGKRNTKAPAVLNEELGILQYIHVERCLYPSVTVSSSSTKT